MISDNLSRCSIILSIKDIPAEIITNDKTYLCFSHTTKGKTQHMQFLDAIKTKKSRLIDLEKITNEENIRLLTFGRLAGIAATIDILSGLG